MQKWIHAAKVMMKNPEPGDMNDDGTVDVFDFALLRKALLK